MCPFVHGIGVAFPGSGGWMMSSCHNSHRICSKCPLETHTVSWAANEDRSP